jgi:hypothetical protein
MAVHEIKMSEGDAEEFRRVAGPHHVASAISSTIGFLWMFTPASGRSISAVGDKTQKLLAEAFEWWQRIDKSEPASILERTKDGLDIGSMDFSQFDHLKLKLRQTIFHAWFLLPTERKTDAELERILRLILDRSLAQLEDDARLFGLPVT